MNSWRSLPLACLLAVVVTVPQAEAEGALSQSGHDGWTYTAATYLWASGLEGESGVFGFPPQHVDLSFIDVIEDLDLAFMGLAEARNGRLSISVDLTYAKLKSNVPGILSSVDVTTESLMGTALVGYAMVDDGKTHVDAAAGARVWSVDTDFRFNGGLLDGQSASDGATWVDPVIGAKFRVDLGSRFYASGWGMLGGFDVSSEKMWDVMGGIGYEVSDRFSLFAGYRAVGVNYANGGFVYDVVQRGPILSAVFRF